MPESRDASPTWDCDDFRPAEAVTFVSAEAGISSCCSGRFCCSVVQTGSAASVSPIVTAASVVKIVVCPNAHYTGCFNHNDLHDRRHRTYGTTSRFEQVRPHH